MLIVMSKWWRQLMTFCRAGCNVCQRMTSVLIAASFQSKFDFSNDVTVTSSSVRYADWRTSDVFFDCDVSQRMRSVLILASYSINHIIYHFKRKLTSQWRQVLSVVFWLYHFFESSLSAPVKQNVKNRAPFIMTWRSNKSCWLTHKWPLLCMWRQSTSDVRFNYGVIFSHNLKSESHKIYLKFLWISGVFRNF
jgi:hypothetical protein